MMTSKKTIIIVLGKNYSTSMSIIRALGSVGFIVDLYYVASVSGASKIAASSKYIRTTVEHVGRNDEPIINDLLTKYCHPQEQYVLMPSDDYTSSLIDRYRDILSSRFLMPFVDGNKQGAITEYMQKTVQAERAVAYGLSVAQSWSVYLPATGNIDVPQDIPSPCFLKPLVSAKGFKVEIKKCETRAELLSSLERMRARLPERPVLVQEFLPISEEYAITGASVNQEVILPALNRKLVVGQRERGVTVVGEIADFSAIDSIKKQLISFIQSFHYTGLFDIDLIRCGEKLFFGEINFRGSGIGYSVIKAGANLPELIVKALCGEDWRSVNTQPQMGLRFFYDKTGWEDVVYGHRTRKQMESFRDMADFCLLEESEDPEPGRLFMEQINIDIRNQQIERFFHFQKMKKIVTLFVHNLYSQFKR